MLRLSTSYAPTYCGKIAVRRGADPVELITVEVAHIHLDVLDRLAHDSAKDASEAYLDGYDDLHRWHEGMATGFALSAENLRFALDCLVHNATSASARATVYAAVAVPVPAAHCLAVA